MKHWNVKPILTIFQWIATSLISILSTVFSSAQPSGRSHDYLYILMPVGFGVAVVIHMYSVSGWSSTNKIAVTSTLIVSVLIGWILQRRHTHSIERLLKKQKELRFNEASFYSQIFPVWSRQIDSSRTIGDKAVAELTALFGEIVSRLGTMLEMSNSNVHTGHGGESGFLGVIKNSQKDFQTVFNDLKTALQTANNSKEMILSEVKKYSTDMRDIAADAQQLAMQSKMISLNAEIEAARAGEAGNAFAAVVTEMRALSIQTAESSSTMARKVETIDEVMAKFYHEEEQMSEMEAQHVSQAETMFDEIVSRFSRIAVDLEKSINEMEAESRNVRDDIASALVALQFQDRLSQILAHVAENISALNELSGAGVRNLDAATWLSDMEKQYSVDEEFGNSGSKQDVSNNTSLLTFF